MKRLFGMFIAMLIIVSGASAEDALPYFEKHGVEILYIAEPVTAVLDECIVFYNDTYAEAYPCDMLYEVTRDDTFGGKRYLNLRVTAGMYDLPELEHNTMAVMFYALRDYYTGTLFDIGTELYERGTTMYDFIVEYGDYSWEIKAGVTINTYYLHSLLRILLLLKHQYILNQHNQQHQLSILYKLNH